MLGLLLQQSLEIELSLSLSCYHSCYHEKLYRTNGHDSGPRAIMTRMSAPVRSGLPSAGGAGINAKSRVSELQGPQIPATSVAVTGSAKPAGW